MVLSSGSHLSFKRRGSAGAGKSLVSLYLFNSSVSCPPTQVQLQLSSRSLPFGVFIDSEAHTEFIDCSLAEHLGLRFLSLSHPRQVTALDDHLLDWLTRKTEPIHMTIDTHHEEISFYAIHSAQLLLILGNT